MQRWVSAPVRYGASLGLAALATGRLPRFYAKLVRRDLGPLWKWLPAGALAHDPNAYLQSQDGAPALSRNWASP